MANILIFHSDTIMVQGLATFLTSTTSHQIRIVNHYLKCLDSANFFSQLGEVFVIIAEGKLLDLNQCQQLNNFNQSRLILCDRPADFDSLILALNCNSSYIGLEHNDPENLILAISCALIGSVFICPQAKQKLNHCVFEPNFKQRQAVAQLEEIDQKILVLASQGYSHTKIASIVNYSPLNIGYRLRTIVQKLNLQTKQEAISLAINLGLVRSFNQQQILQAA